MSTINLNQHIIDELNRFREAQDTFYALQIDAPWGAGKTYFIKDYIDKHCPKDSENSPKNLVVSLFGINSVQEIEQQMSSQLFSGGERLAGSVFSTLAAGAGGFFQVEKAVSRLAGSSQAKILSDRLKEVKQGIIVFDDVERCSMRLVDALGCINTFIEKERFKVVLISNERALQRKDVTKEEKENFNLLKNFKEKLVGRTLRLEADPMSAYDSFVKSMKSEKARALATQEKTFALIVFRASKRDNLRSLRIAIEAFDRIVSTIDSNIPQKDEGLRDILAGCIYVTCEAGAAVKHPLIAQPTTGRLSRIMRGKGGSQIEEPSESLSDVISFSDRAFGS